MISSRRSPRQTDHGTRVDVRCRPSRQSSPVRGIKNTEGRENFESDRLYEEGLRCYKKCFGHMKEHWSDFEVNERKKAVEWKELLSGLKDKIIQMRVKEMKAEIHSLWEQCYLDEADKDLSVAFEEGNDEATELRLMQLRQELKNIRAYHHKHKELIELVKKYEEAQNSLSFLNQQQNINQDRLTNRGALLLKEERHRRLLTKMPQLQKMILKTIREKELAGDSFYIRGEHFLEIVERNKLNLQIKPRNKSITPRSTSRESGKRCNTGLPSSSVHPVRRVMPRLIKRSSSVAFQFQNGYFSS